MVLVLLAWTLHQLGESIKAKDRVELIEWCSEVVERHVIDRSCFDKLNCIEKLCRFNRNTRRKTQMGTTLVFLALDACYTTGSLPQSWTVEVSSRRWNTTGRFVVSSSPLLSWSYWYVKWLLIIYYIWISNVWGVIINSKQMVQVQSFLLEVSVRTVRFPLVPLCVPPIFWRDHITCWATR